MLISLCVPVYNEEKIIYDTSSTLLKYFDEMKEKTNWDFELILSNDGSTDKSKDIIESIAEKDKRIVYTGYETNMGKGSAVRTAVKKAKGDYILFTDSDLAYGTSYIEKAIEILSEGKFDAVFGSRTISKDGYEGYTFIRKVASKVYIKVLNVFAGLDISDSQCGFKVFKGISAHKIFEMCETNRFAFDFEVLMIAEKMKMKIKEIPVKVIVHNDSKVHVVKDSFQMLKDISKIKKRVKTIHFEKDPVQ